MNKTNRQLLEETHSDVLEVKGSVIELKTVILGVSGTADGGLVKQVNDVSKSHSRLKRNFFILVGTLAGSGIIGTGVWGLIN